MPREKRDVDLVRQRDPRIWPRLKRVGHEAARFQENMREAYPRGRVVGTQRIRERIHREVILENVFEQIDGLLPDSRTEFRLRKQLAANDSFANKDLFSLRFGMGHLEISRLQVAKFDQI